MLLRHRSHVFTRVPRKQFTEALRKIYDWNMTMQLSYYNRLAFCQSESLWCFFVVCWRCMFSGTLINRASRRYDVFLLKYDYLWYNYLLHPMSLDDIAKWFLERRDMFVFGSDDAAFQIVGDTRYAYSFKVFLFGYDSFRQYGKPPACFHHS